MSQIYLARRGKIYGPYTTQEYESLCSRGESEGFSWIWDVSREQWRALDPAPSGHPQKMQKAAAVGASVSEFQAICLTPEQTVAALLKGWTETACELDVDLDRLMLSEGQSVTLHLWNPESHEAMNVTAQITQRTRENQGWKLRLRWAAVPQVLRAA